MSDKDDNFPDDELESEIADDEKKQKRFAELITWFDRFVDYCKSEGYQAQYDSDSVGQINQNYWEEMCESVRARLKTPEDKPVRADRHKIASLLEILVIYYQPFQDADPEIMEDVNARAAFYVATNIIGNWGKVNSDDLYVSESFDREHRTWLKQLNHFDEGGPVFSNAATWYLVEKIFIERTQRPS